MKPRCQRFLYALVNDFSSAQETKRGLCSLRLLLADAVEKGVEMPAER